MSNNQTKQRVPLTVALRKSLPDVANMLGDVFQFDANMMADVADSVRSYSTLLKWLMIPNNNADRNFGLNIRVSKKLNDRKALEGFILYVKMGDKKDLMMFEFTPDRCVFNARGLYLDNTDETATRADIEAFQLHLRDVGNEKFFKSALDGYGCPRSGRAKEAYKRAQAVLAEALSERAVYRKQLNVEASKFQRCLDQVFGSYQSVGRQTKILYAEGVTASGKAVSDPHAVRYTGDAFTLQVSGNTAILMFSFGTICVGNGCQNFKPQELVAAIRKSGAPAEYLKTVMKALMAFEIFTAVCPTAEASRRRVLRLMNAQAQAC
jgi:hypothetical protein